MNEQDVERIANELKDLHLIEQSRTIKPNAKIYCNFNAGNTITFDPISIESMSEGAIIWLLLHEEAHLIFPQRRFERTFPKFVIYFMITFLLMGTCSILRITPISNPTNSALIAVGIFFSVWFSFFYFEKHLFFQRYTKPFFIDEFKSDEYGLMGLFIARPGLIGWQEAHSALESLYDCRKKRGEPSLFKKVELKIMSYPHPQRYERSRHLKEIFEKYQKLRQTPSNTS